MSWVLALTSIDWPTWLIRAAGGIPGGALFTAAWSLWIKPQRERKNLARALRVEVVANVSYLLDTLIDLHTGAIPFSLQVGTLLYQSVAQRLGELPLPVASAVVLVYRDFELLNVAVERYHYLCQQQLQDTAGFGRELFREAEAIRQQLPMNIQKTIENAHAVVAQLIRVGRDRRSTLPPLPPK